LVFDGTPSSLLEAFPGAGSMKRIRASAKTFDAGILGPDGFTSQIALLMGIFLGGLFT
jgi:hypothetical protein